MTDSMRPDPYPDHNPGKGGSSVSETSAVSEAAMHSPRITKTDLETLVRKIEYDLNSTRVKLTELRAWIAALDLPTAEQPFNEERFLTFVERTAHIYTDDSLIEELALQQGRPADPVFADKVLDLAKQVRERQEVPA